MADRIAPAQAGSVAGPSSKKPRLFLKPLVGIGRLAALGAAFALSGSCAESGRGYVAVRAAADPQVAPRAAAVNQTSPVAPQTAEQINALRPFSDAPIRPMRPFVLKAAAADSGRAQNCLTQAIYYEAAREPAQGQEAVAQVVLNRVRHPAYPKSICAVVFQGAALKTGCQFTFTCDGSLRWRPEPALWARAERVARRALAGFVDRDVGSATHYHAAYVAPYWAPGLTKMTQVGQHIFYRWNGAPGEPGAFIGRYAGREAELSQAVLQCADPPPPPVRDVTVTVDGQATTYKVAAAAAAGDGRAPLRGVVQPIRRRATPEEIRAINEKLAGLEARLDAEKAANTRAY